MQVHVKVSVYHHSSYCIVLYRSSCFCIQAWNPATEDQCFDRCHRLGQTRDVVVTKVSVCSMCLLQVDDIARATRL